MRRITRVGILLLVLCTLTAAPALACWICQYSPDGKFGFCKPGFNRGWNDCTQKVVDTFNGCTGCDLVGNQCPYDIAGGGGGGGGYDDCWWTDIEGDCVLNLY